MHQLEELQAQLSQANNLSKQAEIEVVEEELLESFKLSEVDSFLFKKRLLRG